MKLLLLGLLAIAVTNALPTMDGKSAPEMVSSLAGSQTKMERVCAPGVTRRMECNICMCNGDGSAEACTKQFCLEDGSSMVSVDQEKMCEPDSTRMIECNTCRCGKHGRGEACTQMSCANADAPKYELYCVPYEYFETETTMCRCEKDGRTAKCSMKDM